ncbi:hypothetical protein M404DRAFT_25271 [Pisolithus tinctorius Marx 270]|uniref:Uncharacterized protein n=1 Tax=Pisolithus tinctorius Marx 270 TaxID=870435 RepID=A0A0C3PC27_PISTI|nr:hypothetical protein M404DRAFT_25271 [Pisolithus tinctorius Marx 270]
MSNSRLIIATDNNNEGCAIIDWTQVPNDEIRYDTDDKEEVMKAKLKERKRHKAAEQAQQEEQAWLEAKRVAREQAKAERAEREKAKAKKAVQEVEERRVCEEEERWEAECKCKAEASKSDEAGTGGASGEARGEVKRVVMDPSCTHCTQAQVTCKFLVDSNKKQVVCVCCNLSKGKCQWPGDGKDAKASPKARRVDKGKKQKANKETPEPGPSKKKSKAVAKPLEELDIDEDEAGGSRLRGPSVTVFSGLEDKLKHLIDVMELIANNLVGLFEAHETMAENSGRITDALEAMLNESYSFRMAMSPLDLGSSELNSNELHKEADWLKAHSEEEEEESGREDETMAEAK